MGEAGRGVPRGAGGDEECGEGECVKGAGGAVEGGVCGCCEERERGEGGGVSGEFELVRRGCVRGKEGGSWADELQVLEVSEELVGAGYEVLVEMHPWTEVVNSVVVLRVKRRE